MCPQANISAALLSNLDANKKGIAGDVILQNITSGEKVQGFDRMMILYICIIFMLMCYFVFNYGFIM
jgi:hypothetical protein